ncbi:MAG: aspartyl protease family protein [Ferruginibacter sp.]
MKQSSCIFNGVIFLLLVNFCSAQEIINETKAKLLTRFPFKQYSGGVMMVHAKLENVSDTLNFILDTGSGGISLDSATCVEFNIPVIATDTIITGMGSSHKVAFLFDQTITLGNLPVKHLNFHINDYEVLSSVYGEKVDGIIGFSFFSRYIVAINFDSSFIEVYSPGHFKYTKEGTTIHPAFTALPIVWLNIKDRIKMGYNFYLDTGAGLCFLMSDRFAEDSNIVLLHRKPVLTQAQGMGGKLQMRLTVIKEVKLGPYRFRQVPTYLFNDEFNVTSYPFTGGLLGNDLLRRFNMVFNYPKREIHLTPNNSFNDRFDYAYTGLGIYYTDKKIMIEDVIADSPADKAKFKAGDEIVVVGTNFSQNITAYKNLLQVPNQDIKVIVRRGENLITLLLSTTSIR